MPLHANLSLAKIFQVNKEKTLFYSLDNHTYSYHAILLNAKKIAQQWQSEGIEPGDTIALVLPNSVALPCCYIACALSGIIACPIPDTHHPELIEKLIETVKPKKVIKEAPLIDAQISINTCLFDENKIDYDTPFLILFTSGLTGDPKAMCHKLSSILGSAHAFAKLSSITSDTRLLHVLPMAYMAGILNAFFSPFVSGATIIEGELFSPATIAQFWDKALEHQANTLSITPTIAAALCRMTRDDNIITQAKVLLRQVQCTSAPIPSNLQKEFLALFSLPLQNCYGMTELGGPLTFQTRQDAENHLDFGNTSDAIQCSLRGEDKQELWIKSPFSMLGYLNNGDIVSVSDEQGYIDTGDIATMKENKLQINGRKKDIIIRGGVNISPARIESVLSQITTIEEMAVVGMEHQFWGEIIVACIVLKDIVPKDIAPKDIINTVVAYSREHLGVHERPDKIISFEKLPRSFIGKIQKNVIKQQLIDEKLI